MGKRRIICSSNRRHVFCKKNVNLSCTGILLKPGFQGKEGNCLALRQQDLVLWDVLIEQ